jgi:cyanophycin synthetase
MKKRLRTWTDLTRRGLSLFHVTQTWQNLEFKALRDEYYNELWSQAAKNAGVKHTNLGSGYSLLSKAGLSMSFRHGDVPLDSAETLKFIGNKPAVYQAMAERGYPIPRYCEFRLETLSEAISLMESMDGQVVVKPASGTGGGRGVTTGIGDRETLRQASKYAVRFCGDLMVEQQLEGSSYRLLYLHGQLIDAVRRDPPTVVGDGDSTIAQLIANENVRRRTQKPFSSLSPLVVDNDCRLFLASTGLSMMSRQAAGDVVQVKRAVNENASVDQYNVFKMVHPETIESGARLVRDLGVKFAGVDVHCQNIEKPLDKENGLITEINTTPGIHHHYLISDQSKRVPVAEKVLSYMFETKAGVSDASSDEHSPINWEPIPSCML